MALALQAAATPAPACRQLTFEGTPFTACLARPGHDRIMLALTGPNGARYGSLRRFAAASAAAPIRFAMNAGMFDLLGRPVGLYVADGQPLRPLSRRTGSGNFFLLPNGVFFGDRHGWHVTTTVQYDAGGFRPVFATQSGPMLVIDGKLHPSIAPDGDSRFVRNAVGVTRTGEAWFVISDAPVSFGRIARLFRDRLDCPNALYLDGSISQLWDKAGGRLDDSHAIGPIVAVVAGP